MQAITDPFPTSVTAELKSRKSVQFLSSMSGMYNISPVLPLYKNDF